jgi:predicted PurR-regulated permease PerM
MLAFIPNVGAIVSGVIMVAVGFSAGSSEGLFAIFVYFFVQNVDGYLVIPYIARRTVDVAPAIVLAMQLIMGALFGILGVLFADPILAALKVTLMDLSRDHAAEAGEGPEVVDPKPARAVASASARKKAPAAARKKAPRPRRP